MMSDQALPAGLQPVEDLAGADIAHFFGSGVCVKETRMPWGSQLVQHRHHYPHLSYLVSGRVKLLCSDAEPRILTGPACIEIPAGVHHAVHALTDAVWLCIHGSEAHTAEEVEALTVAPINETEVAGLVRDLQKQE